MSKGRILIADDDAGLQGMVSKLASKAGYEVQQALDGESALAIARGGQGAKPDLILLDVMMPRMDGRDVLKKLKADDATKDIPVIVYSGRGEHSDRIVGLELGASDYIEKPFNIELLLRKIEYLIWKSRDAAKA